MNISTTLWKSLVVILAMVLAIGLYIGCDRNGNSSVTQPISRAESVGGGEDIMYVDVCDGTQPIPIIASSLTIESYLPNDPDYERALQNGEVQWYIQKLGTEGYEVDLQYSYKQYGTAVPALMPDMPDPLPADMPDTVEVRITTLTMRNLIDSMASVVTIAYIVSPNAPQLPALVHTAIHTFTPPPSSDIENYAAVDLTGGAPSGPVMVWVKDFAGPFDNKEAGNSIATWSWKRWWKCTVVSTVKMCVASAVVCTASTLAYPACVALGCTAGAAGSAAACAVEQWIE